MLVVIYEKHVSSTSSILVYLLCSETIEEPDFNTLRRTDLALAVKKMRIFLLSVRVFVSFSVHVKIAPAVFGNSNVTHVACVWLLYKEMFTHLPLFFADASFLF